MNDFKVFAIGCLTGAVAFGVVVANFGNVAEVHRLRDECEKDLARSQTCEMQFVIPNTTNSKGE